MSRIKKTILLKISGEALLDPVSKKLSATIITSIGQQIKSLRQTHRFALVIGGGNFFRGSKEGKDLDLAPSYAHYIGMLATIMNGLIIKDIFDRLDIPTSVLSALPCAEIATTLSQQAIADCLADDHLIIFTGGTGNPFFSTDTTAVLRGLQINAHEVWKGTKVDGIYDADPLKTPTAQRFTRVTYQEALEKKLAIMDAAAFALAQQERINIRVFNIFEKDALIQAALNDNFGSLATH